MPEDLAEHAAGERRGSPVKIREIAGGPLDPRDLKPDKRIINSGAEPNGRGEFRALALIHRKRECSASEARGGVCEIRPSLNLAREADRAE